MEKKTMYAFSVELKQDYTDFNDAVAKVKAALMAEKMGVISEVNVSGILKAKMEVDYPDYCILGACVAPFAKRILDVDKEAGALLPCNVIVRSEADQVFVTFMHPQSVLGMAKNAEIDKVADEALVMLNEVKARLSGEKK